MANWKKIAAITGLAAAGTVATTLIIRSKRPNGIQLEPVSREKLATARKEGALILGKQVQEAADRAAARTVSRTLDGAKNTAEMGFKTSIRIEETGEKISARIQKLGE